MLNRNTSRLVHMWQAHLVQIPQWLHIHSTGNHYEEKHAAPHYAHHMLSEHVLTRQPRRAVLELNSCVTVALMISQAIHAQVALPARMHAGGRVLQSIAEDPALNATASWGAGWKPPAQPSQAALAAIPVKPSVKASTKAVALQHLKVQLGLACWYHFVHGMTQFISPNIAIVCDRCSARQAS